MSELRVLTYNVRSLRDDLDAVAGVVRGCAPDVVAVQEAPRLLRWRSRRAMLARSCGLLVATADREGGLLVMTSLRAAVRSTSFALLPKSDRLHQRAVAAATVDVDGAPWRVASTHLSVDAAERREHLPALMAALEDPGGVPLVVGADVNEEPGSPVFDALASRFQDCAAAAGDAAPTSPAAAPVRRLDAVFAERSLTVVSAEVVDVAGVERASDHRPVLVVLRQ